MCIYLYIMFVCIQGQIVKDDFLIKEVYYCLVVDCVRGMQFEVCMCVLLVFIVFLIYDFEKFIF